MALRSIVRVLTLLPIVSGILLLAPSVTFALEGMGSDRLQLAANRQCPRGMTACQKGSYGPGGCYKMGYSTCTSGMVCSSGMRACPPGKYGSGGCYKPVYRTCNAGLTCGSGMRVCAKPGKKAYCYKPNYGSCR